LSTSESQSRSSEPSTFCAATRAPSRTGSTQTRTFGTSSTCIMQFGHAPEQQSSPRGRWYLNEREKTRRPAANKADPIVSPSNASTGFPSYEKVTGRSRSIRSCGCGGSRIRPQVCREQAPRQARESPAYGS
jgi:hypothetical protein